MCSDEELQGMSWRSSCAWGTCLKRVCACSLLSFLQGRSTLQHGYDPDTRAPQQLHELHCLRVVQRLYRSMAL